MFESDKMSRFEINKRNKLILIQLVSKLSLYLKYLFKSEKSKKIGHDLFVCNPRVGKHEAPKTIYNIHGNMPGYKK